MNEHAIAVQRRSSHALAFGGVCVVVLLVLVLAAPLFLPAAPETQGDSGRLQPPSLSHPFGTDNFGRDVMTRVLYAGRIDLLIGIVATLYTFLIGSTLGALAGLFEGWFDTLLMRLVDIALAFPVLVLMIAIVALLGPGLLNLGVAIGLVGWIPYARLVRGEVLAIKHLDYVTATRAIGASNSQLLRWHILPNVLAPALILAAASVTSNILFAAALGYLGLGIRPPDPEWGAMIADARGFLQTAPGLMVFPGLALSLTGIAFSILGDGLADALYPEHLSRK
jgi:peptide/nickel transport system permease protein